MSKGVRGPRKGHAISPETRLKISNALKRRIIARCDYCHSEFETKPSAFAKTKRHFCSRKCYTKFRTEIMPPEEHNSYGTGYSKEEKAKRRKARAKLNHYLRDKHIERKPCEICGKKAEAHHDDYDKPLDVRWLCFEHHREWHRIHNPQNLSRNQFSR